MNVLENRVSELERLIRQAESTTKAIHEKVQHELHGSYELLKEEEKKLLESMKLEL